MQWTAITMSRSLCFFESVIAESSFVLQVLREVFREAGLRGLYSGVSAPLLSEVPRRALKFTMNGAFKQRLSLLWPEPRSVSSNVALSTVAGSLAGASETLIHTPFEVVKIRMQQKQTSTGIFGMAKQVVHADGLMGLYTGLEAYALRQIVWNGSFFGLLGLGNATLPPTFAGSKTVRDFSLGLAAGSTATVFNNPLDVAKSRIQASTTAAAYAQRWSLAVTVEILRIEGLNGVCKGLPARLYRSAPGHGLLYMCFELISGFLR